MCNLHKLKMIRFQLLLRDTKAFQKEEEKQKKTRQKKRREKNYPFFLASIAYTISFRSTLF